MLYEITDAVAHPDHTVTVTWSDGARANLSFAPFLDKGAVFEALRDPDYFVREMRLQRRLGGARHTTYRTLTLHSGGDLPSRGDTYIPCPLTHCPSRYAIAQ
jgi:hypothetical protein